MKIDQPHSDKSAEILETLETDPESGLSEKEAAQRREQFGPNKLEERRQKSLFRIFIDQINTPVVYLLAAAAALSFAFGDLPEGIFIVAVILVNAAIGFWMEFQARKSMKALREMDRLQANVIREGERLELDAEELVPGDLLLVEAGDLISADARLVETAEMEVNESALTGESLPVSKQVEPLEAETALADRTNMVFKGTAVTRGKGQAVVTATGMDTEIGAISEMVQSAEGEEVPLDKKLNKLTRTLIWVVLAMAAALGLVGTVTGKDTYTIIQTAIAWAIAAIPEGLPIVASIALARGMLRLADHHVIVKKLSAVEALGETNVIFTDKTGTLTENRLEVSVLDYPGNQIRLKHEPVTLFENGKAKDPWLQHLLQIAVLANDAEYDPEGENENKGDPLEIALLRFAHQTAGDRYGKWRNQKRIVEDPFDSEDKMMGTVYKIDGKYYTAGKGAARSILEEATHIQEDDGVNEMDEETRRHWLDRYDALSEDGLRTLAFAYRQTEQPPSGTESEDFLHQLIFVGLVGFIDPPQEEVAEAIENCHRAGIEVVMVTGDHPGTAKNVAEQVQLVEGEQGQPLRSDQLKEKEDEEIVQTRIFSRVSPGEKLDLVEKFQQQGKIVAMTGDGVNDAPALKKADIGIAMGERGTQVAKETADIVLKDDSFPSIVKAIREGRVVFGNIRKFIVYQLSYHLGEVLAIAAVSFSVFQLALLPLQLLFLNILTDVFPALALGIGEGREKVLSEPPKDPKEPILHRASWISITTFGTLLAAFISGAYLWAHFQWSLSFDKCNDIAFFTLAFAQLLHVFDMRDVDEPFFNNQVTRNKYVWMALALCTALLMAVYFIPSLRELLSFQLLEIREWGLIAFTSLLAVFTCQGAKQLFKLF